MVKCSRCSLRQLQEAFPRKRNLEHLKTCHDCTVSLNASRQGKRAEKRESSFGEEGSGTSPKRKGLEARDGTEVRMRLSWTDFISLVAQHKSDAFELDAEIDLTGLGGERDIGNQEIAKEIADGIWKATDYRFM